MNRIIYILIAFILVGLFTTEMKGSVSSEISISWKKRNSIDTTDVNKYSRKALKVIAKTDIPNWKIDETIGTMKAFIDTAEMICKEKNMEIPALLRLARAEYFYSKDDFNNSYQEAIMAQKLAQSSNDTKILLSTLILLGRYSKRTGSFTGSIDYFDKSIRLAEKEKLKGFIPRSYQGIAEAWDVMGDTIQNRNMLQKMLESAKQENDSTRTMLGFYLLGTSLTSHPRDFIKADSLLKKALQIAELRKDSSFISRSLANMGWNLYSEKKYNEAIILYNKSLYYSIPARLHFNSANSLGNLGTIYRDMDNIEKALYYYRKSIYQAELGEDAYNLSWVYNDMSQMYLAKKDTANAYKTFVLFKKFSDAMLKTNSSKGLDDAMIQYEASTQEKENELLTLRVRNQQLLIYGYTGLILLSLTIGLLMFNRSRIQARNRVSELNRQIAEVTQANLRQQMNPHFIFNTLNSIQYYMYQHDKLATNNYLTKFSSLMRKVLENSQHTSVPLRDELEALELYLGLEKIRFKEKFDYSIMVDEEIDTILYKVPTMLIQPYVENSISHGLIPADEKGMIRIDLKLKNDYISCVIEDNGIGREAAHAKKNSHHNSLGTQIVSSRLELVNTLYGTNLKTVYTDLISEKGNPEGTRVEIHIPILT